LWSKTAFANLSLLLRNPLKQGESFSVYTLDFETMKQVMREHQKTGYLYADLPSGLPGLTGPCRVEVHLASGTVIACAIVGSSGQRLAEKETAKQLARMGSVKWIFTPGEENAALSNSPVYPNRGNTGVLPQQRPIFFPQRTAQLEQWQMQSWPRMHRTVFALADGTRSVGKIAEMLSSFPDTVEKVLLDLQSIGVITMTPQNGNTNGNGRNSF
jgi:hypothetical protein